MRGGCFLVFGLLVLALVTIVTVPPASADTNPPAGTILYPLPGTWTPRGYVSFSVRFTDLDGISQSSVSMTLDGVPVGFYTSHNPTWTDIRLSGDAGPVPDGPHNASASASDVRGNGPTVLNWSFSSDSVLPVVTITYPVGNPVIANGSLVFAWTGSDVGSGIDHYVISIDQEPQLNVGTATSFPFHDLAPGMHYFYVTAYDVAGNYPYYYPSGSIAVAVATVPTPSTATPPPGNTTVHLTLSGSDQVPPWGIGVIVITTAEAVAVAALALRPRRPPEGGKPTA